MRCAASRPGATTSSSPIPHSARSRVTASSAMTAEWRSRGRASRPRAVRGRRRRGYPAPAAAKFRFSHPAAAADRDFLQAGGQGQRAVLRQEAAIRSGCDEGALDLRLAYQSTLHIEGAPDGAGRPRRFRRCYKTGNRAKRKESEKFKRFPLKTLLSRDKVNLDIFWLKDHALDDPDLLPPPDEVAAEIVESLKTALDRFRNVAKALGGGSA